MSECARSGLLLLICSPSGAGKSTLAKRLLRDDPDMRFSVSVTTRAKRPSEVDGRDFHFKTCEEFKKMVADGIMLEHAEVFGNFYGSPLEPVASAIENGRDVLFDVDWQGEQQIRASTMGNNVVSVFLLPPSLAELEHRLRERGQDSADVVSDRMAKSRDEVSHWAGFDYVFVNENLDVCEAQLRTIVAAERLRRERQPGLAAHVGKLNAEFEEMI